MGMLCSAVVLQVSSAYVIIRISCMQQSYAIQWAMLQIQSSVWSVCYDQLCVCRWLPALQNIFFLGNKRKQIPLHHLDAFFDGVAVVMTNQLREMTLASISDYMHVFCPVKVGEKIQAVYSPVILLRTYHLCRERSVPGYSLGSHLMWSLVALSSSLSPTQPDLR